MAVGVTTLKIPKGAKVQRVNGQLVILTPTTHAKRRVKTTRCPKTRRRRAKPRMKKPKCVFF